MIYKESEKIPAHDAKEECGRIFTAPERKKQWAFEHFVMYKTSCHKHRPHEKQFSNWLCKQNKKTGEKTKTKIENMDRETNQEWMEHEEFERQHRFHLFLEKTEKKKQVDHGKEKKMRVSTVRKPLRRNRRKSRHRFCSKRASELKKKKTALQTETFQEEQKFSMISKPCD